MDRCDDGLAGSELDPGSIIVNDSTNCRLDSMPFGGMKRTGIGHEGVKFSIGEVTEKMVVCFTLKDPHRVHR